jgi:hypothetical protein
MLQRLLIAAVAALGLTGAVKADDKYYMMIFAAQAEPNVPAQSHTFGLFAKVSGNAAEPKIETTTISWFPASLQIEPLRRDPVEGKNISIADTLQWAASASSRVSMWGPFPIKKDLYDMAVAQAERLASGRIQYVMLDTKLRGKGAYNCIHALSDVDRSQPELSSGTARGEEASKMVLSYFDPYILKSKGSNRWLVDRLGLSPDAMKFVNPDLVAPK